MSVRKIIQIVPHGEYAEGLTVLCDDGSLWRGGIPGYWVRLDTSQIENPPVPPPPVTP